MSLRKHLGMKLLCRTGRPTLYNSEISHLLNSVCHRTLTREEQVNMHLLPSLRNRLSWLTPSTTYQLASAKTYDNSTVSTRMDIVTHTSLCTSIALSHIWRTCTSPICFQNSQTRNVFQWDGIWKTWTIFSLTCEVWTTSSGPRLASRSILSGSHQPLQKKEDRHDNGPKNE